MHRHHRPPELISGDAEPDTIEEHRSGPGVRLLIHQDCWVIVGNVSGKHSAQSVVGRRVGAIVARGVGADARVLTRHYPAIQLFDEGDRIVE